MPRDVDSGLYTLPAGVTAVADTTIESAPYNTLLSDIRTVFNTVQPVAYGGTGAATAAAARTNLGAIDGEYAVGHVASVEALRTDAEAGWAYTAIRTTAYHPSADYADGIPKGGALYRYDDTDTTTADNDITVIVGPGGKRWKLVHDGAVTLPQCGGYCDGETDDLDAMNAVIALLNDNNSGVHRLDLPACTFYTSDTPNALYRSDSAIIGAGAGASSWKMASTAGTFLTLGYLDGGTLTAATRWQVGGFRGYYTTDGASTTAIVSAATSEYAFDVRAAAFCGLFDIVINQPVNGMVVGYNHADGEVNQCVFTELQFTGVAVGTNGGIALNIQCGTGNTFNGCYWAGAGKQVGNSRALKMAPVALAPGIDGNLFAACIWNFNDNDMDYGFEFDSTNPAVQNSKFIGCTMDCGSEYAFLFKIGSAATSANCTIFNHAFTGCRITAGLGHPSGGGGAVHVVQEVAQNIHGIEFNGCIIGVGVKNPFFKHDRSGGASVSQSGVAFNGCTVGISPTLVVAAYATTGNITLSGVQNIDGGTGASGQTILVKNQTTASQNGVYSQAAGAWTRLSTFDAWDNDIVEAVVAVTGGSTNAATLWLSDAAFGGTLGSTNLAFSSFDATRTMFEGVCNNFTVDGMTVTFWGNKYDLFASFPDWPFLDYVVTFNTAAVRSVNIDNMNIRGGPLNLISADMSTLSSTSIEEGPFIGRINGAVQPPHRAVQTTDATVTEIARTTLVNNQSHVFKGYIVGKRNNNAESCKFSFDMLCLTASGSVTIKSGGTLTADYEADDASVACTVTTSGLNVIWRVAGPAAKTYDWAFYLQDHGVRA